VAIKKFPEILTTLAALGLLPNSKSFYEVVSKIGLTISILG
jgi:hypothetical protein